MMRIDQPHMVRLRHPAGVARRTVTTVSKQVAEAIREKIAKDNLPSGQHLLTVRAFAKKFDVTTMVC
jgi:DNA-binding transcriptional regulator YhcF (GntR family)